MPKLVDYPRAAMVKSLELATAVYDLGRSCSVEMAAEHMGKKVSGGFSALVSATVKYGLITNTRGQLECTELFKDYYLGYSDEEKAEVLKKSFLSVPLFLKISERFKGQKLPSEILDKLLIREFHVDQQIASRVAKYFIEGARTTNLLNGDNILFQSDELGSENEQTDDTEEENLISEIKKETILTETLNADEYTVLIKGPGINSTIRIHEEDDLDIVEVMLKKVRKKLSDIEE